MAKGAGSEIGTKQLAELIDALNCGLWVRDADNLLMFANATLARWLGYERSEMIGATAEDFVASELHERAREEMEGIRAGDLRVRVLVMRRKDGTTFPALMVPALWHDEFGHSGAAVSVVVDLAAVHSAKQVSSPSEDNVRAQLDRIADELRTIGLAAGALKLDLLALDHPQLEGLSSREKEVLAELAAGERVASIASKLFISHHTVRNHLKSIYRKLDVGDQSALIKKVRSLRDS